jgi:hypothetical protein
VRAAGRPFYQALPVEDLRQKQDVQRGFKRLTGAWPTHQVPGWQNLERGTAICCRQGLQSQAVTLCLEQQQSPICITMNGQDAACGHFLQPAALCSCHQEKGFRAPLKQQVNPFTQHFQRKGPAFAQLPEVKQFTPAEALVVSNQQGLVLVTQYQRACRALAKKKRTAQVAEIRRKFQAGIKSKTAA